MEWIAEHEKQTNEEAEGMKLRIEEVESNLRDEMNRNAELERKMNEEAEQMMLRIEDLDKQVNDRIEILEKLIAELMIPSPPPNTTPGPTDTI